MGAYETTCPRCGERVLEVGLIMPFNLDDTVHSRCTLLTFVGQPR